MLTSPIMAGRESISRRDAMLRLAGAGIASALLSAQTASAPQTPSWNTELRQLAPNVYAYTQASGPGIDNASLSNAGVIVGDDLLAIDALGPRFTPKPSSPVPSGPPASRSAGWST